MQNKTGNKKKRKALGRGLTSLIPLDNEENGSGDDIVFIDMSAIRPNPFQPRTHFNPEHIVELAQSISTQGLLQPLVVRRKSDGSYEIVSGERRFRALNHLKQDKAPCVVKPQVSDRAMLEMALVENIQRERLNDIESARAYERLQAECGLSHEELSKRVGKSRSAITNNLRLLKLPEDIQLMIAQGEISGGHARALLAIEDGDQRIACAQRIVSEKLSVRETEQYASRLKGTPRTRKKKTPAASPAGHSLSDPNLEHLIEQLRYKIGTPIKVVQSSETKGKLEISFFNKNDLVRIVEILNTLVPAAEANA